MKEMAIGVNMDKRGVYKAFNLFYCFSTDWYLFPKNYKFKK